MDIKDAIPEALGELGPKQKNATAAAAGTTSQNPSNANTVYRRLPLQPVIMRRRRCVASP
jgi:hypothetical protein